MVNNKCSECNINVKKSDKSIHCAMCEEWKHLKCDNVKEETYIALNTSEINDDRLHWFCSNCNEKAIKGIKMVIILEKRTIALEAEMAEIKGSITEIKQERQLETSPTKVQFDELQRTLHEMSADINRLKTEENATKTDRNEVNSIVEWKVKELINHAKSKGNEEDYDQLMNESTDNGSQDVDALRSELESLKQNFVSMSNAPAVVDTTETISTDTINQLKAEIENLKTTAKSDAEAWNEVVNEKVRKEMKRLALQNQVAATSDNKRANNIIIYRAKEDNDLVQGRINDKKLVDSLLKQCGVEAGESVVKEQKRLGAKEENRDRPILVVFKSLDHKKELYSNIRNLKDANDSLKSLSIDHDMSREEREVTKKLVAEAKKLELEDPTKRYRVRGPPGNQRVVGLTRIG